MTERGIATDFKRFRDQWVCCDDLLNAVAVIESVSMYFFPLS